MPENTENISSWELWWETFVTDIWERNPVFVTTIGLCPTLAVSTSVMNCLSMGIATMAVLLFSSTLISALRNLIPNNARIICFIIVIATFVQIVDYSIQAISLDVYNALGAFIQLIVVNCIILGHAESYAYKNPVGLTFVNSIGVGLGFTLALLCLGIPREILGSGSFLGYNIMGEHFQTWLIMLSPAGGFIILGLWLAVFNWTRTRKGKANIEGGGCCHE